MMNKVVAPLSAERAVRRRFGEQELAVQTIVVLGTVFEGAGGPPAPSGD